MQTEKVINHITNWLKEYANNANIKGFVVGVSGGIDSAITSTLCAKTGLQTLCVEMPIHQAQSQVNRAQEHIALLKERYTNVTDTRVNLTSVFEEFKSVAPKTSPSPQLDLSLANTRARLRMTTLYYFAGLHKYLVAGTGNKVEDFGVGFFTKYGDGGVDLSPIADLTKSQVYALGKALEVPNSIQIAAPTDGLFGDSRSDEDQIGASYDELEWAMKMKDEGRQIDDFEGREQEVFKIFIRLNTVNQHKMNPIPACKIPFELL
ncbi:NAD(+) synthase [Aquimarina sp. 2201CG1-2-11]|uniref:NAD(+) synthase n=1 Tax=Aquimarina discodermiae TaxID=3231043 RepID=UPI0034625B28